MELLPVDSQSGTIKVFELIIIIFAILQFLIVLKKIFINLQEVLKIRSVLIKENVI